MLEITKSNSGLRLLPCIDLANDRKLWNTVEVDFVGKENDYDFWAHADPFHVLIVVQLFKLVNFEVVPHDHFVFGPLGVRSSANEGHDVLSEEHLYESDSAVQVTRQLQSQRVTLINLEA